MKKVFCRSLSRAIAAMVFVLALPALAAAQNVAAWFAKPANTAVYGSIAAEVEALGASIRAASLSDSLIAKRLEEAARKHVAPATLLATLKADTGRALFVAKALGSRGLLSTDPKKSTFAVEQATLLLRAGIDETELGAVLDASVRKSGRNEAAVSRALAALLVAVTAEATYKLSESESLFLAIGLVTSNLPEGKLDTILASVANLVKNGSSVSDALEAVIEKVSKGNSTEAKAAVAEAEKGKAEKTGNKENEGKSGEKDNGSDSNKKKNNSNSGGKEDD